MKYKVQNLYWKTCMQLKSSDTLIATLCATVMPQLATGKNIDSSSPPCKCSSPTYQHKNISRTFCIWLF